MSIGYETTEYPSVPLLSAWLCLIGVCPSLPQDPPADVVAVLVARHYLPAGTLIQEPLRLFRIVRYLKTDAPAEALGDMSAIRGVTLLRSLAEDQPLKKRDVTATAAPARLLLPGMRAFTLPIDSGIENVTPQMRVNLVLRTRSGDAHSELCLIGVTVLAATPRHQGVKDANRPPLVTFAITNEQARDLLDALNDGVEHIGIRPPR